MSTHNQRGKVKTMPRTRNQRMPVAPANFSKCSHSQNEDNLGIYSNSELTYALGRHVIGNIGEVLTVDNERILGVIKAISPAGDMGLAYAYSTQRSKNGQTSVNNRIVPLSNWKMVRVTGIKPLDCLTNEVKTDAELANECDSARTPTPDKELVPFFAPSEAVKDCSLDEGGFPVDEMFKTNKEKFSVASTYNSDLREYTTPVDRSAPNFSETEARCAKLAEDIERNQSPNAHLEVEGDDEEEAFSAVSREPKDQVPGLMPNRRPRPGRQRVIVIRPDAGNTVPNDVTRVSLSGQKPSEALHKADSKELPTSVTENESSKNETPLPTAKKLPESESTVAEMTEVTSAKPTSEVSGTPPTTAATPTTEAKVKKSTLDPNAPLFHPMGMQFAFIQPSVQQQVPQAQPVLYSSAPTVVNVSHPVTFPMQSLPTFINTQQAQRYAAVTMPYASHSGQIPHLLPNVVSGAVATNVHQMRAGSLPPNLHQQGFAAALNPGANILLQHPQQPGISLGQMTSQPLFVTGPAPGHPFATPNSNMGLARQRSNESSSTTHSNMGQPQPNVSMSTFQSPTVYHFTQPTSGFPFLLSGPQVGPHLLSTGVPGAGCPSALMLGNMAISQTSGQQMYPGQTVIPLPQNAMQVSAMTNEPAPPPSTTPQQHSQQIFPQASGHFPDPAHHFQFLQCGQGLMFAPNQPSAAGYYPTGPTMLAAPNSINQSVAGLLPMMNQSANNQQQSISHQPNTVDPSMVNPQLSGAQFSQVNCQPQHLIPQFSAAQAQFMHAQQLNAGQHLGHQHLTPSAYQAMVAGNNNAQSQAH